MGENLNYLLDLVDDEIDSNLIDCEGSEVQRFIADLGVLGVHHRLSNYPSNVCAELIKVAEEGMTPILSFEERLATTRDTRLLLDFFSDSKMITINNGNIEIPPTSIIRKVSESIRSDVSEEYKKRANLFLFGYVMLIVLRDFIKGSKKGVSAFFITRGKEEEDTNNKPDKLVVPRYYLATMNYLFRKWYDGIDKFTGEELSRHLSKRGISANIRSRIMSTLEGRDPKTRLSLIKGYWQGFDQVYEFADYVTMVRERLMERKRLRERE